MKKIIALSILFVSCLHADDTVVRSNGAPLTGKILGSDASGVRVEVVVVAGQGAATMTFPASQIKEVTFGDTTAVTELLRTANASRLPQLAQLWQQRSGMLAIKGSLADEIGLNYARWLLTSPVPGAKDGAMKLYEKLIAESPDPAIKARAGEGRLQALVAVGRASEAVEDAKKLAANSEDPSLLIQAKFILAEASFQELKKLELDNPKWEEDVNIRPKRNLLYHDTLDLYLFPSLFFGAETEPAARGLWSAIQVCKLGQELPEARELARDIEVLYPSSNYVAQARAFVLTLPQEIQKQNYEKQKN